MSRAAAGARLSWSAAQRYMTDDVLKEIADQWVQALVGAGDPKGALPVRMRGPLD